MRTSFSPRKKVLKKTRKTGLLAFGSSWFLHLPIRRKRTVVFFADFVTDYSCGAAPVNRDSTRRGFPDISHTVKYFKMLTQIIVFIAH